jgi:regulator of replication initiation timing
LYLIRKTEVEKKIKEIDGILSNCSCFANEKVKRESDSGRREDLIRSHQEEKRLFNSQLEEMKRTYKEIADRQQTLIESERRENKLVRVENSQLQHALGLSKAQAEQLEIRLTEKSNELNQQNQALERLRQAFQELLVSNTAYQAEARVVKEQMD